MPIKTCEDLTVNECESLVFDGNDLKCFLENNQCKLSSCYDSAGECESFIANIPIFYCKEDSLSGRYSLYSKKCEEMPNDLCDLWNEKLKTGDGKCVQGKDKCKLKYEDGLNFFDSAEMIVLILVGLDLLVSLLVILYV